MIITVNFFSSNSNRLVVDISELNDNNNTCISSKHMVIEVTNKF